MINDIRFSNFVVSNRSIAKVYSFRIFVVALFILFVPLLIVFNNLSYGDSYAGYEQLVDDHIAEYEATDPRLIDHIRTFYTEPPADRSLPYQLNNPSAKDFSHKKQSEIVAQIVDNRRNGVFFEAGGYDGETYSNSLYFERELNWTGALIEPDFANVKRLRQKNRKSWLVRSCLDGSSRPQKLELFGAMEVGSLNKYMNYPKQLMLQMWRPTKTTKVWCFPITSILMALNMTTIDYMIIDIEGAEMDVLKAIPFHQFDIKVLQIEYMVFNGAHWYKEKSQERREAMRQFFKTHLPQYKEHSVVFLDLIFVKDPDYKKSKSD